MAERIEHTEHDVWGLFNVSWSLQQEGLNATLTEVLERCSTWFDASGASLFLREDGRIQYRLTTQSGPDARLPEDAVIFPGEGISGACIDEERPLLVVDPNDHRALAGKGFAHRAEISSSMVIPLMTSETGCIGVLNLSRSAAKEPFAKTDLDQAQSVGKFIALAVSNARLVSQIHQASTEARKAQAMLQEVIQCLGVGVIVVDSNHKVTHGNPAALELLAESGPIVEHLHAALADAITGEVNRSSFEDTGSQRTWSIICTPMKGGGATAALEEVTDQVNALRELSRINRLAEIGQMTAAVAHEIRNPLTSIRGAANLLKTSPEQSEVIANIIEEETLKLNELCNEFLEFARPMVLRLTEIDLAELATKVFRGYTHEFRNAQVHYKVENKRAVPTIYGDLARIEQVLHNLIANALQACKAGDSVTLRINTFGFEIEDTGEGMSSDQVEKLFTPFFTTKAQGTGLGLSNVRKIVDAHGGQITVKSEPGNGTLFMVELRGQAA